MILQWTCSLNQNHNHGYSHKRISNVKIEIYIYYAVNHTDILGILSKPQMHVLANCKEAWKHWSFFGWPTTLRNLPKKKHIKNMFTTNAARITSFTWIIGQTVLFGVPYESKVLIWMGFPLPGSQTLLLCRTSGIGCTLHNNPCDDSLSNSELHLCGS